MKFVGDFGATLHASTVLVGEKLGLYKALAASGGMSPADLAGKHSTDGEYLPDGGAGQAASGYVAYNTKNRRGFLAPQLDLPLPRRNHPPGSARAVLLCGA